MAVLFCFVASAQYNPTSSKTRFVNGIGLGTKSDAAFGTVDSLVLYATADSTLKFKYKGTARALLYSSNVGAQIHDSLYANYALKAGTSAGGRFISNSGSIVSEWGAGGGTNFYFHGFAGYNANRASSYTARSFTDKNYVDSLVTNGYVDLTSDQTISGLKSFTTYLRTVTSGSTGLQAYNSQRGYFIGMIAGSSDSLFVINYDSGYSQAKTRIIEAKKTGELKIPFLTTNGVVTSTSGWLGSQSYSSLASSLSSYLLPLTGNSAVVGTIDWRAPATSTSVYSFDFLATSSVANATIGRFGALSGVSNGFTVTTNSGNTGLLFGFNGDVSSTSLGTGTVYSNSGTLTNTNPSDSSIKNTIKPLGYGLSEVLRLQPKTFYYNSDSAKTSLKYGFIAQEVQKIMPDMVRKFNVSTKVNGKPATIEKLGLETDGIYVTLVKAIQEQQAIIDDLKKRIIALENK